MSDYPQDWQTKLLWMLEHGVVSAEWDGATLKSAHVDLGRIPPSTQETTQQEEPKPDPVAVRRRTQLGAAPALTAVLVDR